MQPGDWGELRGEPRADGGDVTASDGGVIERPASGRDDRDGDEDGAEVADTDCDANHDSNTDDDTAPNDDDRDAPGATATYRGP